VNYETDWAENAACRDWPQGLWFFEEGSRYEPWRYRRAQAICEGCPVRRPCLEYALRVERAGSIPLGYAHFQYSAQDSAGNITGETFKWKTFSVSTTPPEGIWGGFTPKQRHAREFKHKKGCKRAKCSGCKPLTEWVDDLMEGSAA